MLIDTSKLNNFFCKFIQIDTYDTVKLYKQLKTMTGLKLGTASQWSVELFCLSLRTSHVVRWHQDTALPSASCEEANYMIIHYDMSIHNFMQRPAQPSLGWVKTNMDRQKYG